MEEDDVKRGEDMMEYKNGGVDVYIINDLMTERDNNKCKFKRNNVH